MDIEQLIAPVSAENPCGPDLEYDQEYMAFEQAARGKPEQQFGDTKIPAEEPDWRDIAQRAQALLARTKDLRVAVLLTRALAHTDNFVGVAAGLQLVYQLLSRYWDEVHPRLDADDNNDPTMRLNALMPLVDNDAFLRDLRSVYLVQPGRHGRIIMRDLLVLAGVWAAAGEEVLSQTAAEGILRASAQESEQRQHVDAVRVAVSTSNDLQRLLVEKVGIEWTPNLKSVTSILGVALKLCDSVMAVGGGDAAADVASAQDGSGAAAPGAIGGLRTRDDAIQLLDRICEFLERTEPSHPAPLLLKRARRLLNMSFLEIIQDIAPDGLNQTRNIAGLDKE